MFATNPKHYYHRTQQYSITALTDSSGTIKERYAYDAYGNLSIFDGSGSSRTATTEGNRYTYTGRERDGKLGLYHYRARIYCAETGRFLCRDPIGYFDHSSLYEFSDTLSTTDPGGRVRVSLTANVTGIGSCGTFSGTNKIGVNVDEAESGRGRQIFIVQHIQFSIIQRKCEGTDKKCCKPGVAEVHACEWYEIFGVISAANEGAPRVQNAPGIAGPNPFGDSWESGLLMPGGCGDKGVILFRGETRAVRDPDGSLERAWRNPSPSGLISICPELPSGEMRVNNGYADAPAGWESSLGSVSSSAGLHWDCCGDENSVMMTLGQGDGSFDTIKIDPESL
ncbi:tRNA3(Ser)-specific nuclease WapA precursor [Stieleria neptunia]|uniref:tRNA3(Ser)-specific nuclease WapA n=1 Tax=Stieleria neptunia TaxID=2527979 RepID=A0A518HRU2_9BACT|nr:RHS repeat-associated core domain-containing protein [Stieleria neptunia]QDV43569.1 tRNA3(Ser)-specific nuclease WapA precursor [Stieleria neptunia]